MKKIICMFIMLSLLVCIVGCSQAEDSGNQLVQDYSEEYEVSPYGNEEELDTLKDLKISLSTENDLDLKQDVYKRQANNNGHQRNYTFHII